MIEFRMVSCLITFEGKYFEYRGKVDKNNKGLAIGVYESPFLANLVTSFFLEHTNHHFNNTKFFGIYRDNGITIFNDKKKYFLTPGSQISKLPLLRSPEGPFCIS